MSQGNWLTLLLRSKLQLVLVICVAIKSDRLVLAITLRQTRQVGYKKGQTVWVSFFSNTTAYANGAVTFGYRFMTSLLRCAPLCRHCLQTMLI